MNDQEVDTESEESQISQESNGDPNFQRGNRIVYVLDEIEKRVELLRDQALSLNVEKTSLLESLHMLQFSRDVEELSEAEKEEMYATADRLICRCLTVDITLSVPRNENQEKALQKVEQLLADMDAKIKQNEEASFPILESYLNSSLPDPDGPVNDKFQKCLIECTADDQKRIRKQLQKKVQSWKDIER